MRETVRDWKHDWVKANGETNDLEIIIENKELEEYIYEGSFKDIPESILDKKVIEFGKVINSTVSKRIGAYSLRI